MGNSDGEWPIGIVGSREVVWAKLPNASGVKWVESKGIIGLRAHSKVPETPCVVEVTHGSRTENRLAFTCGSVLEVQNDCSNVNRGVEARIIAIVTNAARRPGTVYESAYPCLERVTSIATLDYADSDQ